MNKDIRAKQNEMDIKLVQFSRNNPEFADWVESDDCEINLWDRFCATKSLEVARNRSDRSLVNGEFHGADIFADKFNEISGNDCTISLVEGRFGFAAVAIEVKDENDEDDWDVDLMHSSVSRLKEFGFDKFAKNARDHFVEDHPELILKLAKGEVFIETEKRIGFGNTFMVDFAEKMTGESGVGSLKDLKTFRDLFVTDQYQIASVIGKGNINSVSLTSDDEIGVKRFSVGVENLQKLPEAKIAVLEDALALKQARERKVRA